MIKTVSYDEFVQKIAEQGPITAVTQFAYDIALPDIDSASVNIKTQFTIKSPAGIKKFIDHVRQQLLKPGEGDNTVTINTSEDYHSDLENLLQSIVTDSEGSDEVSQLLLVTDAQIEPIHA